MEITSHANLLLNKTLTSTTYVCSVCSMTTLNRKQRITIFIDPSIAKHAKAEAVVEETTLTELIEKALLSYLPKETIIKKAVIKE